jgi:hypothetical protein
MHSRNRRQSETAPRNATGRRAYPKWFRRFSVVVSSVFGVMSLPSASSATTAIKAEPSTGCQANTATFSNGQTVGFSAGGRVYVAGYSNGAFMASALACSDASKIGP